MRSRSVPVVALGSSSSNEVGYKAMHFVPFRNVARMCVCVCVCVSLQILLIFRNMRVSIGTCILAGCFCYDSFCPNYSFLNGVYLILKQLGCIQAGGNQYLSGKMKKKSVIDFCSVVLIRCIIIYWDV